MDVNKSRAIIISQSNKGVQVCSSAGRISTTEGTALSVFEKSKQSDEANNKLISKVLASGHKTIIEHHHFSIAFNNVSIIVEQFLIEFRLSSFTIKSRRYVDFSNAGFIVPKMRSEKKKSIFTQTSVDLFSAYSKLMDLGLTKEDARYLLPYDFKSNLLCSCDARELLHIICTMIYGRGSEYQEILSLGKQLKRQFDKIYPDLVEKEKFKYKKYKDFYPEQKEYKPASIRFVESKVKLLTHTQDIEKILKEGMSVLGLNDFNSKYALADGKLARILEQISFTFKIKDISLANLTHLTRHRMQSIIIPNLYDVINKNTYKYVPKIFENEEYLKVYKTMIKKTNKSMIKLRKLGAVNLSYLLVSGRTVDVMTTMNARELLSFCKLRTCDRAQWEMRQIAKDMLKVVKDKFPQLVKGFGPSCLVDGYCPEGRLSCGNLKTEENFM